MAKTLEVFKKKGGGRRSQRVLIIEGQRGRGDAERFLIDARGRGRQIKALLCLVLSLIVVFVFVMNKGR